MASMVGLQEAFDAFTPFTALDWAMTSPVSLSSGKAPNSHALWCPGAFPSDPRVLVDARGI